MHFLLSRQPRILLIRYDQELTRENLERLDVAVVEFIRREGTMDSIVDFSSTTRTDLPTSVVVQRGRTPALMQGRRRVFVTPNPLQFGLFRQFGAHQDSSGARPPEVVTSLDEALALLGAENAIFEPYNDVKA